MESSYIQFCIFIFSIKIKSVHLNLYLLFSACISSHIEMYHYLFYLLMIIYIVSFFFFFFATKNSTAMNILLHTFIFKLRQVYPLCKFQAGILALL